jgi:glyoxylase-like metal-dependent hydrolase (beta-lactamase superfamily II)
VVVEMLKSFSKEGVLVFKGGNEINGRVLYWVNFYMYENLMIDSGCIYNASELKNFLAKGRLNPSALLITHYHEDHIGAASSLKIPVYAGEKTVPLIKNPPEIPEYRKIVWGQPKQVPARVMDEKIRFPEIGIEVLKIETPGHSPDHTCFLIDDKLFMGDLMGSKRQSISMREENYLEVIESLKKILKLDFSLALGGAIIATREEVTEYLEYLLELKEKVNGLYSSGASLEEIVEKLFGAPSQRILLMELVSGKEWARENFIRSLIEIR